MVAKLATGSGLTPSASSVTARESRFASQSQSATSRAHWAARDGASSGHASSQMAAMSAAGIHVVKSPAEIGEMMAKVLGKA